MEKRRTRKSNEKNRTRKSGQEENRNKMKRASLESKSKRLFELKGELRKFVNKLARHCSRRVAQFSPWPIQATKLMPSKLEHQRTHAPLCSWNLQAGRSFNKNEFHYEFHFLISQILAFPVANRALKSSIWLCIIDGWSRFRMPFRCLDRKSLEREIL